jgi:hypothetical protein
MAKHNLLSKCNAIPPKLCRLLARKHNGRRPMSNAEIAAVSGLARCTITQISKREDWNGVPLETIHRFTTACGINLVNQEPQRKFFRHSKLSHIMRAPNKAQKRMLLRLLKDLGNRPSKESHAGSNPA